MYAIFIYIPKDLGIILHKIGKSVQNGAVLE
jgi:hypothetical protein